MGSVQAIMEWRQLTIILYFQMQHTIATSQYSQMATMISVANMFEMLSCYKQCQILHTHTHTCHVTKQSTRTYNVRIIFSTLERVQVEKHVQFHDFFIISLRYLFVFHYFKIVSFELFFKLSISCIIRIILWQLGCL